MNKILILLLIVGYGVAGTEDYNYKCEKAQQHNKKETCKAMTYAYKALIQKTFCLFSGEDTDNTHSDDITKSNSHKETDEEKNQKMMQETGTSKIDKFKVKALLQL